MQQKSITSVKLRFFSHTKDGRLKKHPSFQKQQKTFKKEKIIFFPHFPYKRQNFPFNIRTNICLFRFIINNIRYDFCQLLKKQALDFLPTGSGESFPLLVADVLQSGQQGLGSGVCVGSEAYFITRFLKRSICSLAKSMKRA